MVGPVTLAGPAAALRLPLAVSGPCQWASVPDRSMLQREREGGRRRQRSRSWRSLDETGQTRPRCSCPQDRSHRSMSEAVMVAVTIGIQPSGAVQIRCATWHRSRRILDRDRSGYCGTDVRTIRSAHIQRLVSSLGTVIRHRRRIRPAFSFRHFERAHGKTISRGGRRHRRGIHRHPTWRSAQLDRGIGCRSPSPRMQLPEP